MQKCQLIVDGRSIDSNICDYTFRFVKTDDNTFIPVLYYLGKRVVQDWKLDIDYYSPVDENGRSA